MRARFSVKTFCLTMIVASRTLAGDLIQPVIDGEWWSVGGNPDLGEYTRERQQPVDFGVWQAADGSWQLWSCIRHTGCGGHTRLFYRWEGDRLTDRDWKPMGIAMEASPELGEARGGLQAPHVIRHDGRYLMAYGNWSEICFATSIDGKTFERRVLPTGRTGVFGEGAQANARDPMLIRISDLWYCYYTANPARRGAVYCRTSRDLEHWSHSSVVCYGGSIGNGPWFSECPHVVEVEPGQFVLFRNQYYGQRELNWVYQSTNPLNFGIDDDSSLTTSLRVAAPEIILHEGKYYLAALKPGLDGIRMARLKWIKLRPGSRPLLDFDEPAVRAQWKRVDGDLPAVFTSSTRSDFAPPRRHFIGTAETAEGKLDDDLQGVIESPGFTLERDEYYLYVSGGSRSDAVYVAVVLAESGEEIARLGGEDSNALKPRLLRCASHRGKRVKIRVVDRSEGAWGHINFGGVFEPEVVWEK